MRVYTKNIVHDVCGIFFIRTFVPVSRMLIPSWELR